ncbi:Isoprenylcysteine carboxyl methyltransferase family-domain-containing protein [Powellomyces hirtus]|nr:Isoprenylcysteine carboxyl methyltransferase family-domain-containing protein [Powellomyces hirtus]
MFGTASSPGRSQPESGLGPLGLPIFDGHHTPQNIAAHAYLLGCLHGFGVGLGFCSTDFRGLGFFVGSLALFHVLEYLCTAMYRSDVKMSAFLLNNGREYQMAMAAGVVEYFVWYFVYPPMNAFRWWNWIALMGMVAAQYLRSAAMITAGSNFTHLIAAEKDPSHTLVTTGIYATFRHPSYTAFYYWAVCTQLTANNPFCSLAFSLALYKFFRDRIIYEERTLIEFFGDEYERYIKTAKVWIPYIE